MSVHHYRFDRLSRVALWPIGVRGNRDGVRVEGEQLHASFGPFTAVVDRSNIKSASATGPYWWIKAVGPRLSFADRGLTFGTNPEAGVCLEFHEPLEPVLGIWKHPNLTLTVEDPAALLADLGIEP